MNRLIIIGNGFDLAHDLKTSYCHFISDYLINLLHTVYQKKTYEDPLIFIRSSGIALMYTLPHGFQLSEDNVFQAFNDLISNEDIELTFKSNLLKKTIQKASMVNWADIENEYIHLPLTPLLAFRFVLAK